VTNRHERCETCKFFELDIGSSISGRCHRRAPEAYSLIRYYELELLREIAWNSRILAGIKLPAENDRCDLNTEATETVVSVGWPEVEIDEWCGEWQLRNFSAV
jgi:hypothetical protein